MNKSSACGPSRACRSLWVMPPLRGKLLLHRATSTATPLARRSDVSKTERPYRDIGCCSTPPSEDNFRTRRGEFQNYSLQLPSCRCCNTYFQRHARSGNSSSGRGVSGSHGTWVVTIYWAPSEKQVQRCPMLDAVKRTDNAQHAVSCNGKSRAGIDAGLSKA